MQKLRKRTTAFTPNDLIFEHTSSRPSQTVYNYKELISKYVRGLNTHIKRTEAQNKKSKLVSTDMSQKTDQHTK